MSFFRSIQSYPLLSDVLLFVVRVFIGFAMISHGFPKLMRLAGDEEISFYNFLGLGEYTTLVIAVIAEFVCSIFIILGLFTRFAISILIITMSVIAFMVHAGDPFSDKEMSLIYLSVYLLLFAFGPGKFSVDGMISSRRERSAW